MKKILLLYALLLAVTLPFRAVAAGPPDIVVVRINDDGRSVKAIITRGEGKSEKVEFEAGYNDKNITQASEGYYKLLYKLYQEGYMLQGTFANGGANITLLFVKAQ